MRLLITCGPSSEPIDQVRRITNFSTGKSGIFLSNYFTQQGHAVTCLASVNRTCHEGIKTSQVTEYATTHDLGKILKDLSQGQEFDCVLHLAALSDYTISKITDSSGNPLSDSKISSNHPSLHLTLKPAPKLISQMRAFFPKSKIIGWKYELEGEREEAVLKAFAQIQQNKTDACVLNGRVIQDQFIFCESTGEQKKLPHLQELATHIEKWLEKHVPKN